MAKEHGSEWLAGAVLFRGAQLLLVRAGERRFYFKIDTSRLPEAKEAAVGELWEEVGFRP